MKNFKSGQNHKLLKINFKKGQITAAGKIPPAKVLGNKLKKKLDTLVPWL